MERDREWLLRFNDRARYETASLKADFQNELNSYSNEKFEPYARGARLAAATKRYKNSMRLGALIMMIRDDVEKLNIKAPDITPLVARKLISQMWGKVGSQDLIVAIFGEPGRIQKSTDNNREFVVGFAWRHRARARAVEREYTAEIERVKVWYQKQIREKKKQESASN